MRCDASIASMGEGHRSSSPVRFSTLPVCLRRAAAAADAFRKWPGQPPRANQILREAAEPTRERRARARDESTGLEREGSHPRMDCLKVMRRGSRLGTGDCLPFSSLPFPPLPSPLLSFSRLSSTFTFSLIVLLHVLLEHSFLLSSPFLSLWRYSSIRTRALRCTCVF